MIISQIVGGLGNQLFQYASARQLSLILNQEIYLDLSFFETYHNPDVFRLDKYNVNYKLAVPADIERLKRRNATGLAAKFYRKLFKKPYYLNSSNHFDQRWLLTNNWDKLKKFKDVYISGYLANPSFFYRIEDLLKEEFTLKVELNKENKEMMKKIEASNAVMLHVRRGDYVNNNFFVSQPVSYYVNAIRRIKENIDRPVMWSGHEKIYNQKTKPTIAISMMARPITWSSPLCPPASMRLSRTAPSAGGEPGS